jgi:molybdate transport system permease protein
VDWSPFWLSLRVACGATVLSVLVGLPIAYVLARARLPGRSLLDGLVNLPLVLPPTVLGYALLVLLGRKTWIGKWYEGVTGHSLVFTWQGAVVAAAVASLPLFIGHARVAIAAVDPDIVAAARTDGAGRLALLRLIFLPLARPGLIAGVTLAFARALGDFGATLMVAGDTPGRTQTMPLAIYDAVFSGDASVVRVFIFLSTGICFFVCVLAARLAPPRS